jgi:hypothetical protein
MKQPKHAKPVRPKRRGPSGTLVPRPVVHHSNFLHAHTPVDLQHVKDIFDQDPTDDVATSMSTNSYHFSASEDLDHQLDPYPLPPTLAAPHPKSTRKRPPVDDLERRGGDTSESGHIKRLKKGKGPLTSSIDTVLNSTGPVLAPSTSSRLLPPATQSMVTIPLVM